MFHLIIVESSRVLSSNSNHSQNSDNIQAILGVLTAIASLLSAFAALYAIKLAIHSERRAETQFENQQREAERIAMANVKPLLIVTTAKYTNEIEVRLENAGAGTAIITDIETRVQETGRSSKYLKDLIDLQGFLWDTYYGFDQAEYYLRAGDSYILLKITANGLISQKMHPKDAEKLLENVKTQLDGIKITITYKDILDNKQPIYKRGLFDNR